MGINSIFDNTVKLLERDMDLRSVKHQVIASNIANMDTPDYKTFDFMVEEELKKPESGGEKFNVPGTDPKHFSLVSMSDGPVIDYRTPGAKEHSLMPEKGNTVDLDREMAKLSKNSILYNMSAQMISTKFQSLENAIQGGR